MPARTTRTILARVVHDEDMGANLGAKTIAVPEEQTHVDRTVFVPTAERAGKGIDDDCVHRRAQSEDVVEQSSRIPPAAAKVNGSTNDIKGDLVGRDPVVLDQRVQPFINAETTFGRDIHDRPLDRCTPKERETSGEPEGQIEHEEGLAAPGAP